MRLKLIAFLTQPFQDISILIIEDYTSQLNNQFKYE